MPVSQVPRTGEITQSGTGSWSRSESFLRHRMYLEMTDDHYAEQDGLRFAGTHLLLDMWGTRNLTDASAVEAILRDAAEGCGATLVHLELHSFAGSGGITGIAILAESHMSIHTWPESGFVAVDIFTCGSCDPYRAIPILKRGFAPSRTQLGEHRRGVEREAL